MGLMVCPDCSSEISDSAEQCIKCGRVFKEKEEKFSEIKAKSNFLGKGCIIQGIGCPVALLFGMIAFMFAGNPESLKPGSTYSTTIGGIVIAIFIVFLIAGSRSSKAYYCELCGTKLERDDIKICPICSAKLWKKKK